MSGETKDEVRVGSRLWEWDGNRRVYARDAQGRSFGGPIPSEQYVEMEVVGETRLSWIVARPGTPPPPTLASSGLPWGYTAVDKKTMRERGGSKVGYGPKPYYTDAARTDAIWLATHKRNIINAVERSSDVDVLRRIAEAIGYAADA